MLLHQSHGMPMGSRVSRRARTSRLATCSAVLVPWLFAACTARPQERHPAPAADLAITHATVVDVLSGGLLANRTLLVASGRIVALGSSDSIAVPTGARVVEATGQYVIPGLWDAHVHAATSTSWHFPLFIAHGITSVRNMHTGVDTALELTNGIKSRLASGALLGPRFLANGPIVDGEPAINAGSVVVRTATEARAAVDSLASAGADFIKVYARMSREAFFALAEQATRRGIAIDGHVPNDVRPEEAARAGLRTEEHLTGMQFGCSTRADSVRAELERGKTLRLATPLEGFAAYLRLERALYDTRDATLCRRTAEAYRRYDAAVVPTLVISHHESNPAAVLADSASMRWIPAAVRRRWESTAGPGPGDAIRELIRPTLQLRRDNVRMLGDVGVTILAGTDVGNMFLVPGLSLHQELALLVQAGLSPLQALQAATVNPARRLLSPDSLGNVAVGQRADLVLLAANPLDDIRNTRVIAGVVLRGRFFDRSELDALLAAAAQDGTGQEIQIVPEHSETTTRGPIAIAPVQAASEIAGIRERPRAAQRYDVRGPGMGAQDCPYDPGGRASHPRAEGYAETDSCLGPGRSGAALHYVSHGRAGRRTRGHRSDFIRDVIRNEIRTAELLRLDWRFRSASWREHSGQRSDL